MQAREIKTPLGSTLDHVLVVDDNYASRFLMKSQLERMRCDVTLAENGRVAINATDAKRFDLILMDIQMPIVDGVEATRAIQNGQSPNRQTPIIAVTAYSMQDFTQRYDTSIFAGVLLKPFVAKSLMALWLGDSNIPLAETQATEFTEVALLDQRVLAPLCQAAAADILARLLSRFWDGCADFIAVMDANITPAKAGHVEAMAEFRRAAHGLKGATANIGLLRASRICAALQNTKAERMDSELLALKTALEATKPELSSYVAQHCIAVSMASDSSAA